jgi:hypothetical protein
MDSGLLKTLFGSSAAWHGACTVLVDAETTVKTTGTDSIVQGGVKSYSPRVTSGRVAADAVCFHPDHNALLTVQRVRTKGHTGEEVVHQTLIILDVSHVVGVEFEDLERLARLGLAAPPMPDKPHYAAGTLVG